MKEDLFISDMQKLEDEVYFLNEEAMGINKELRKKKLKLAKMYEEGFIKYNVNLCIEDCMVECSKKIEYKFKDIKVLENRKRNIINLLKFILENGDSDYCKIDVRKGFIYLKSNDVLKFYKPCENYTSKELINGLKEFGLIEGNSKEYYKSVRINGNSTKVLHINLYLVNILLKEDKAD